VHFFTPFTERWCHYFTMIEARRLRAVITVIKDPSKHSLTLQLLIGHKVIIIRSYAPFIWVTWAAVTQVVGIRCFLGKRLLTVAAMNAELA